MKKQLLGLVALAACLTLAACGGSGQAESQPAETTEAAETEQPADNAQAADDSQVKDETPKTGQSLNPKYVLCIGVMLLGIYMILTSERQEKQRKRANG